MDSIEQHLQRYERLTLTGHKSTVHSIRWNPNGTTLATGGKDKMLHLYRIMDANISHEPIYSNSNHSADIEQLCWNPDNPNSLATASLDKYIKIWDTRSPDPPVKSIKLKNENVTICWSGNGSTIAVGDKADAVTFIDIRKGFEVDRDVKFHFEVGEITWNKENDLLFVTSNDGNIHVLSYPDLQTVLVIDAHASPCVCIRFDPSGKRFAVGSNDAVTSLWDSENFACYQAIDRLDCPTRSIGFSHDGRYLASGSEAPFIDIANTETGYQETMIPVPTCVLSLDFHPKEYILAYTLSDNDYREVGQIKIMGFPDGRRRAY